MRSTTGWIAGTTWIALHPVPTTATRRPASSTSWFQRAVWKAGPAKRSSPGMAGTVGAESCPQAVSSTSASWLPALVSSVQRSPSQRAAVTSVPVRAATPCRRATSSR